MKKLLSIMLSILMVVTMLPMAVMPASAAENESDGVIYCELGPWAGSLTALKLRYSSDNSTTNDIVMEEVDHNIWKADLSTNNPAGWIVQFLGSNQSAELSSEGTTIPEGKNCFRITEYNSSSGMYDGVWYQYPCTSHEYKDGICPCGYECPHEGQNGSCEICGANLGKLVIDVTDKSSVKIGTGREYYDEDGYIITGTNQNTDVYIYESADLTLKNAVFSRLFMQYALEDSVINITLDGTTEVELVDVYKAHLIFDGGETDTLKTPSFNTSGNPGSVTVNGGNIILDCVTESTLPTIICAGGFIINGGTVTASNNYYNVVFDSVTLNGGELNIISTSTYYEAIMGSIIIEKGALLTVSATKGILDMYSDIVMADDAEENDYFFVRYDTESEFVPVPDIKAALDGKTYAEIKIDTHEHSLNNIGKCICGYECPHESITDNKCDNCGAEGTIVTIEMTDSYGDGWNGNAVVIKQFVDGVYTDTEVGTATIEYGAGGTFTTVLPKDGIFALSWLAGDYPSECSFTIAVDGECVYSISDARGIENNAILYTICEHTGGKADCLHRAVCENCGNEYGEVDADGHDWSNKDGICANGCGETCPHSSYTDGVCDNCDYECAHEWGEGVLTRPIKITTTDWDDGYYTYTCSACGHYYHEAVKRADYTALDAVSEDFIDAMYDTTLLDSIRNELQVIYFDNIKVLYGDYIESEQAEVDALVETMTQKLAEVEAGVADGSALKPNYTEGDALINGIIEQFYDKGITYVDEIIAEFDTLYNEYLAIWRKPETTKPQVDEIVGELKALKEKIDKGTEDGTLVKIDGIKEYNKIADALDAELMENYSQEEIAALAEKAGDEINVRFGEIIGKAGDLTGSVAENKDALAEIESEMRALYGEIKNCLDGVHNGFVYEVTEEAKCEVNVIESATCTLCGETDEREVEGTALEHSFTKYEEVTAPKCGVAGKEAAICDNGCGVTDEKEIPALTHKDADGDYKCDYGCGHEFEKPAEPEDPSANCDHLCHSNNWFVKNIIWKIVKFFWKLFKMNPVCECGAAHY